MVTIRRLTYLVLLIVAAGIETALILFWLP